MSGRIGFIGLGLMGSAMVARLIGAGHVLTVLGHTNRTGLDGALALGATEASNARELAAASDAIMICVATSEQVESRVYGPDGILAGIRPDALVIDFGTSLPASSLRIAAGLAAKGAHFLDAPMGRTPSHARQGKLNLMVGGSAEDFARARPLFAAIAENIFHVGAVGTGHILKLINNFYAMTNACAMAEAFVMAGAAGLSRQALYDVLAAGPNKSGMLDFIKAHAIDGQSQLAFTIGNAAKDIGYYSRMAADLNTPSAMSGATLAAFAGARDAGWGHHLIPEMVDYFAAQSQESP